MRYRKEIDGLRALAVVSAIGFHAGFTSLAGGFLGVDIFFVISGYLITTLILQELHAGKFSLLAFYERRARRILPVLFLVIVVSAVFVWWLLLPPDMDSFYQSAMAAVFFVSNVFFWQTSDYFQRSAELQPLLHTWSLGIEEQFYALFPLAVLAAWVLARRSIPYLLALVLAVSLAVAYKASQSFTLASFYALDARAWELMLGALSACALLRYPRPMHRGVCEAGSLCGLAAIIYAVSRTDNHHYFDVLAALVPTLGTVLIILCADSRTMTGRLLGNALFVRIGLMSYSLYLWHQPLFALTRSRMLTEPDTNVFWLLIAITAVLSYFSWRYVEQPFRYGKRYSRKQVAGLAAAGAVLFSALGICSMYTGGFEAYYLEHRLSRQAASYYPYMKYDHTSENKDAYGITDGCFIISKDDGLEDFRQEHCLKLSRTLPNVLLIGDSHAAHLSSAIRQRYTQINLLQATASGCRPLLPYEGEKRCMEVMRYAFETFLPAHHMDTVILSGRWKKNDLWRLNETVAQLRPYAKHIILVGPTLEYRQPLSLLLMRNIGPDHLVDRDSILLMSDPFYINEYMKSWSETAGVQYVSVIDSLCTQDSCITLTPEGVPIGWDETHFTVKGAQHLLYRMPPLF